MIPPLCGPKAPLGERELFDKLKYDPATSHWVVLHSLDLKRHRSKIEGELDIVVLVPGLGVLCVEVKGCEVSRQDGKWIYPYETSVEGPFKQAAAAMHSLREYLVSRDSTLSRLLFFSCVVFTRVDFDEESPEWHPWQYINRRSFFRRPISSNVSDVLERAHAHVSNRVGLRSWYGDRESRPTEAQIRRMVKLLRDNFEYPVSPRVDVDQLEQAIRRFTEEQLDALDLLEENERVVFRGPAGTGKTFLALEAARRATATGHRVLLACYNNLLGDWLKVQATEYVLGLDGALRCQTFHSLLMEIAGKPNAGHAGADFWRKELPCRALDRLLTDSADTCHFYDYIVIDEAQDLLEDDYLDVMDALLRGGLAGGRWAFFGDFERQAIYVPERGPQVKRLLDRLTERAPNCVKYSLRINCRNAAPIAETLVITSGLSPGYRRVLHDIEGAEVDPVFYASQEEQEKKLAAALRTLGEAYKPGEIVVLSTKGDEASCAANVSRSWGIRLVPIRQIKDGGAIAFTSIHAFKGCEAPAVVLTDVETLDNAHAQSLLYVGMSRARIRLFMLMHESCRASYDRLLDAGLQLTAKNR